MELDSSNAGLNKKVRNAQLAQFNYICVVGEEEAARMVDVRARDSNARMVIFLIQGKYSVENLIALFKSLAPAISDWEKNLWLNAMKEEVWNFNLV